MISVLLRLLVMAGERKDLAVMIWWLLREV
jgi:hypothetical protein